MLLVLGVSFKGSWWWLAFFSVLPSGHRPSIFKFCRWIVNAHVLVKYMTVSTMSWPMVWLRRMTSGKEVESRMNLTCVSGLEPSIFNIRSWSGAQYTVFTHHRLCSLCLIWSRAGQTIRRCSRSPNTWWQVSDRQYPFLFPLQNLHIISVLYLPLTILAKTVLFEHSKLFPAEVVHMGWGCCSEALKGLKKRREVMVGELHSHASTCCQYSVTFNFTLFKSEFSKLANLEVSFYHRASLKFYSEQLTSKLKSKSKVLLKLTSNSK